MLARIRKAEQNDKGFTLIELLVVVIIIGILSAIAIPTFLKQREKGWDKAVKSDLRNNALKMEEYLDDNGVYPTTVQAGFKNSDTIVLPAGTTVALGAGGAVGFCLRTESAKISATSVAPAPTRIQHFLSADGKPAPGECPAALP